MSMIRRSHNEKGQVLVLMVLAMTVVFVVGAIAVDIGLWLSERRGSQTDADFLALSGAWELLDPAATVAEVNTAVDHSLLANDGELNLTLQNPPDVDMAGRCVSVDVDHDSSAVFFSIFGLLAPEIGAHAKACAGPVSGGNLIPFEIDNDTAPCFTNEEPNFATLCPLELGAQGENPRGMLDLEAPDDFCSNDTGDGDIQQLIEFGTDGPCLINTSGSCPGAHEWIDCAATQTGNPKKVLDGTQARLERDGMCDGPDANTWDDFDETVILVAPDPDDPLQNIYSARDCDPDPDVTQISPRLVTIIVFEEYPTQNNTPYPIIGLAGFYIAGCAHESETVNSVDDLNRYCNDDYEAPASGAPGHAVVYGNFVNLTVAGGSPGGGGSSSIFGIYLVE